MSNRKGSDMTSVESLPFALMHVNGCGGIALLMPAMPLPNSLCLSSQVRHIDGSKVELNSRMICDSCGKSLSGVLPSHVKHLGLETLPTTPV